MVDEFYSVCTRRKLKVNAGKEKMLEKREVEVVDFTTPYRMSSSMRKWRERKNLSI